MPIPKPGTDKFRPISLTSCFCKVLERILLTRLMFRLQDKLSPCLYGFLSQRSTHHCLMELYSRLSPTSVVAFLDLKSAFDIANREIILEQLVEFGVRGNLRWIRGYLRNRTSRVLFHGASSTYRELELGTPQGGVLSPFLFSLLMHRLLTLLPDIPGTTVLCYVITSVCIPPLLLTFNAFFRLFMIRHLLVVSSFPLLKVESFLHGVPEYFLSSP